MHVPSPKGFASGMAGRKAKDIIKGGAECVSCSKPATMTLDFDIFGQLEQLPVCAECLSKVRDRVAADLRAAGRDPSFTFGINGWGRS
jgi:hypothetical protein